MNEKFAWESKKNNNNPNDGFGHNWQWPIKTLSIKSENSMADTMRHGKSSRRPLKSNEIKKRFHPSSHPSSHSLQSLIQLNALFDGKYW